MMMAMKVSIFAAALGVACLLPATTHAQAEESPDTYDVVSTETIAAEQHLMAANTAKAADFQGSSRCLMRCAARERV